MKPTIKGILIFVLLCFGFLFSKNLLYSQTNIPGIPLESNPVDIAINPVTDIAVVANEKSDSVSIVDLNTQTVISTIPVGKFPKGVAIDNEFNLTLVSNNKDNTLSLIDLYSFEVIATIPVGKHPQGIALNQNTHTALVANHKDKSVSVIDLMSYSVIETIPVGREPIDIAIDPELGLALVVNEKGHGKKKDYTVSVINLNTYEVTREVPVGKKPQAIDINPETHTAIVANEKDNTITVINLQNWDSYTIPVEKHPVDVAINSLDNRALVICDEPVKGACCGDRTLLLIDLNTDTIVNEYLINHMSNAVAVNPYTNIAGVVDSKTDSLTLIQLPNPIPEINSINPDSVLKGSSDTLIDIEGNKFITSSLAYFDSEPLDTTFTDNHNIQAVIPAEMLLEAGTYPITVTNPEPEGGPSEPVVFTVLNPVPELISINPTTVSSGGPDFTLTLTGNNFIETSIVSFNNQQLPATFISETQIEAIIPSEAIEIAGNYPVTVINPAPGGGESEAVILTVTTGIKAIPGAYPTSGTAPLTVYFTTDGEDPSGTIEIFRWDFDGNGTWDTYDTVARDYIRTYTNSGTYIATLFVQSSTGETATASITITVENSPPVAIADVIPSNGEVPLAVQLQGSGTDADGTIVLYEWDAEGDGTFEYQSTTSGNTTHTYQNEGTYQAVFRVTDNEGAIATASATATAISVGPPGSPTAAGTANPSSGSAPLTVNFSGTGTDPDGTIVKYEWDFTNDGTYDYSSTSSASTSYTYDEPGDYVAAFRVTDNDGLTGVDLIEITATIQVSLSIADPDKTVNPTNSEEIGIDVSVNASVPASILIKNTAGETVRTIPVTTPAILPVRYNWDVKDDYGIMVNDGVYYAILQYIVDGQVKTLDLTDSTGGTRYSFPFGAGCDRRSYFDSNFSPFEDNFLPLTFTLCKAQEVTAFIGPLWSGADATRVRTIVNRKVFPAGTHTIYWDGLDDNGNIAVAPPGDSLITGFWRYGLSDNAIVVTGGKPSITAISAEPNYFSPFSEKCDENGNGEGVTVNYTLSEDVATVELQIYSVETGSLLRTSSFSNVLSGDNVIFWDGKNNNGEYIDIGDYSIGLIAIDAQGNESMFRYTLVRVDY